MKYLTGDAAAALLGISRRSLYRWASEGRLPQHLWAPEYIEAHRAELGKRPRGPRRNPNSLRYTVGRHRFEK
jgi:hypothetical protein